MNTHKQRELSDIVRNTLIKLKKEIINFWLKYVHAYFKNGNLFIYSFFFCYLVLFKFYSSVQFLIFKAHVDIL